MKNSEKIKDWIAIIIGGTIMTILVITIIGVLIIDWRAAIGLIPIILIWIVGWAFMRLGSMSVRNKK